MLFKKYPFFKKWYIFVLKIQIKDRPVLKPSTALKNLKKLEQKISPQFSTQEWRSWLRQCATSWKVAGSIPDGVIIIFIDITLPHALCMALESTKTLKRNENHEYFLGVKAAGVYGWQLYHIHVPIFLIYGNLNFLEISQSVQGLYRSHFSFN
jgi:hypothetical protein